jgi:transcriptional regulator with XRE-family HTH domain
MPTTIGEKIKKLRKELKLTQSQLAGDEMTKSMLSQIENNVARPSMKNLQYLASKLNKSVSYFLDEEAEVEFDEKSKFSIEIINDKLKEISKFIEERKGKEAEKEICKLLQEHTFNKKSKIYADIIYYLGRSLNLLERFDEAEEKLHVAIKLYSEAFLYTNAARAYLELVEMPWSKVDFKKCLDLIDETKKIYNKSTKQDTFFEIELLRTESIILSALDNNKETLKILKRAIELSNDKKVYYKSGELHKTLALIYLMEEDYEAFKYNMKKAKQYAEFTENKKFLRYLELLWAFYENKMNNPHAALEHIRLSEGGYDKVIFIYYLQKGIAYYLLGEYEKALENIRFMDYPTDAHHKFDYQNIWSAKIYEGLILNKLNGYNEAVEAVKMGIDKMEIFSEPESKQLAFAYKSLSEIYSHGEEFEAAFKALKKANDIEDFLKTKRV